MKRLTQYVFGGLAVLMISLLIGGVSSPLSGQNLDDWKYSGSLEPKENAIVSQGQFNGYTSFWANDFWKWIRYGNLWQISAPNAEPAIAQSKLDIAEELGILGLWMEEGFLNGLLSEPYRVLQQPALQVLLESLGHGNLLVYVDPSTPAGDKLLSKLPKGNEWKEKLKSYQFDSPNYIPVNAFYLESGNNKIFVVASSSPQMRGMVQELIGNVESLLAQYDMHRGWFGTGTLYYSVTCWPGHPLEVIGKAMNQGNDFATYSGYMDYLMGPQLESWLSKVNLPFVTDVGTGKATHSMGTSIFGCNTYENLAPQDMPTETEWIKFAKEHGGYVFRPVWADELNLYQYDGYLVGGGEGGGRREGAGAISNKEQLDNENVPFVVQSGFATKEALPACMVLFVDKGVQLTKQRMWDAILSRKEVGVISEGQMVGPKLYRNALQMLLLDRVYLEEYFGERIQLQADVQGQTLVVSVTNAYAKTVSGTLRITVAPELTLKADPSVEVVLPAKSSKTLTFPIQETLASMNKDNPILAQFTWGNKKKATLTVDQLPVAVSVHRLLYGNAPTVSYPVTVHNFSDQRDFPVKVQVVQKDNPANVLFEATQNCSAEPGKFGTVTFLLRVPAGSYTVKASAIGAENTTQLGVGEQAGAPYVYPVDLNHDGVNEYRMENDKVQVTLLATGARVIEYIVKERDDNVFFKLWPEKASDDKRPFRKRGYYPFGGFEDFLGQGSMETWKVYDAEITKKEGDYVQVKMTANYFGNILEKTFTLYGNSPLLEIRWALTFKNPEANIIGPQPIMELGKRHWTEDQFLLPTFSGLKEFRMRPEEFYGRVLNMKEGWNVVYDTQENETFIGAFPVTQPHFMHMWMNHPANSEAHFYYAELQPWIPIYQKSVMYFSYYIWADAGPWQDALKALKERNLITTRETSPLMGDK